MSQYVVAGDSFDVLFFGCHQTNHQNCCIICDVFKVEKDGLGEFTSTG